MSPEFQLLLMIIKDLIFIALSIVYAIESFKGWSKNNYQRACFGMLGLILLKLCTPY